MNKMKRALLMLLIACIGCIQTNAQDRTKAFGYSFSPEELVKYPQKTNLPTIYLEVYKTQVDATTGKALPVAEGETPELEDLNTVFGTKNEWYYNAQIIIRDDNGTIEERIEPTTVRGRGNATWDIYDSQKKPLRLKFPKKTALLGDEYAKEKSWTLLANHLDITLIRNAMANETGKKLGLPFCPAYKFVDLIVNGTYMGTYQISDQVQAADKRVPISENTGYFIEANSGKRKGFLEDPYMKVGDIYVNIKSPDPDIENGATATEINDSKDTYVTADPKYDALKTRLGKMVSLAKEGNYAVNWMKYIDVETAVNAFIGEDISGNRDGTVANNYAYMNDIDSKLFFGPLWDFDLAWGCYSTMEQKHFWEEEITAFGSLCKQVFDNDPYFVKALYERWQTIYDHGDLITYLQGRADAISASINESATQNFLSRSEGGAGEPLSNWANNYTSHDAAVTAMKAFIDAHLKWLDENYKAKYDALGCASLPDLPETGLVFNSTNEWGGKVYSFIPSKPSDVREGAVLTITLDESANIGSGPSPSFITKGTRTLTADDVAALNATDNIITFIVYNGNCTSVTLVPPACAVHDYSAYLVQDDGTYRQACAVCSELKDENEVYYKFTVYPESSETTELYATSWEPAADKPNSIAVISVTAETPAGHNIINDGVCADFRLTDGHPYYNAKKFTATKATYSRTVTNDWGTMVLPFKYQQASNETASFYHLSSISGEGTDKKLVLTAIQPEVEGNASAYVPVFFKRANSGVSVVTVTGDNVTVKKSPAQMDGTSVDGWTLKGVMTETMSIDVTTSEWDFKKVYYISDNKFWHATGKVNIMPFRAYLEGVEDVMSIGLQLDNEDITGIKNVTPILDHGEDVWYSLDGHLLNGRPSTKGIYIHNGRKEVIQ